MAMTVYSPHKILQPSDHGAFEQRGYSFTWRGPPVQVPDGLPDQRSLQGWMDRAPGREESEVWTGTQQVTV